MQILPLMSHHPLWKTLSHLTPRTPNVPAAIYANSTCTCMHPYDATRTHLYLLFGWLLFVCVFFFLLRDNWAAMTAAFPPNGRGQINLPVLMSANGKGPLLPPPCLVDNLLWVNTYECACQVEADINRCHIWWWIWCSLFDFEPVVHLWYLQIRVVVF